MKTKLIGAAAIAAILAVGFQTASANWEDKSPEERQQLVQEKLDRMQTELNLTTEQETEVRDILNRKAAGELDKEAANEEINSVLTEQQQADYERLKEEMKKDKESQ